jgi:hypothetical protein
MEAVKGREAGTQQILQTGGLETWRDGRFDAWSSARALRQNLARPEPIKNPARFGGLSYRQVGWCFGIGVKAMPRLKRSKGDAIFTGWPQ